MSKRPWNITQLESKQSVPPTTIKKLGWGVGDGGGFKRVIFVKEIIISLTMTYTLIYFEYGSSESYRCADRSDLIWRYSTKNKVCGPYYMTVYFVIQVEFQWTDVKFLF